jgi:hypothetical protein
MSTVTMEWESRLGRRLRVRDLHILSTVVRFGSMAKAAQQLAMTQPAVSGAIALLELIEHRGGAPEQGVCIERRSDATRVAVEERHAKNVLKVGRA